MGEAVVKILNKAGIEVVFPEEQTCCGAPARYSGAYEVAAQNATDNIEALLAEDVTYVVSACPTCTVALKHEFIATFESLGHDRRAWPEAQRTGGQDHRLLHPGEEAGGRGPADASRKARTLGKITYHDSCHLKRTLHAEQAAAGAAGEGGLRAHRDVRVRHVLRHGRLLLAQAAGDLGARSSSAS